MTVVTMASFGLTTIASAQTITNTGPGSHNRIDSQVRNNCTVTNHNTVSVYNRNYQDAQSGNATVSGNTNADSSASWDGWDSLDPAAAQADGLSYNAWRNGVTDWMGSHSSGNGWNSNQDNLTWTPSGNDWASYNPEAWQANGQSFGNWWNGAQGYLDSNSSNWLLGWPSSATGDGNFGGATSGNASNNNNSSFAIRINNSARALAGTNKCGQSNFTPPPVSSTPGKGGGPSVVKTASSPQGGKGSVGGSGNVGGFGGVGGFTSGAPHGVTTSSSAHPSSSPSSPSAPGSSSQPPSNNKPSSASISNTGPGSNNVVSTKQTNNTTVTNTTKVTICNTSSQDAQTGNATVSGNTNAGNGSSGSSGNGNGTGVGASLAN
jgi:hypothetical protein